MDTTIAILFFVFGLTFGSFLNVCIYRLPRGLSVVRPGSACPTCGHCVRPWDNIPVLSWIILGGKCRDCRAPITPRYLFVELITAALFVACYADFGLTIAAGKACVFSFLILGMIFTDLETRLLPDLMTFPGLALGIIFSLLTPVNDIIANIWPSLVDAPANWRAISLLDAIAGAATGAGILWAIRIGYYLLRHVEGMGLGDIKLMGMVGAFLGFKLAIMTIFFASILGSVLAIVPAVLVYRKRKRRWLERGHTLAVARQQARRSARHYQMPFGVSLGAAALALMFFGNQVFSWYWSKVG